MHTFTFPFAAGLAAVALLLAAPAAHAQSPGYMTADSRSSSSAVASIGSASASTGEPEATRNLSATTDEATSASYYNDSHKDLKQALAWMQETNALHPEYWSVYAEARIRLQLKDYAGAQTTVAEAKKLALAAANQDYARRCDELLTQAKARAK